MTKQTFDINKIRVASPCSVAWDAMTGDARARHCDSCQLNVYNIAEMTHAEVEKLITSREGRLCIRLYKRADGTVITKDCPVGWRAYQKRVARFAGAALATVLGLFSVSFGQKYDNAAVEAEKLKITPAAHPKNILEGTITDPNGAVVPNAEVSLFKGKTPVASVRSDENGYYAFSSVAPGTYRLEVKASGFKTTVQNLKINGDKSSAANFSLEPYGDAGVMGIYVCDTGTNIDPGSTTIKTTITKDMMMRRIP